MNWKKYRTHRLAYELTYGEISDDILVCHSCDNPPCCNPDHLFLGTPNDNTQDKKKGRARYLKGSELPQTKLTKNQTIEIIQLYHTNKYTQKYLGERYGVSRSAIDAILRGTNWK